MLNLDNEAVQIAIREVAAQAIIPRFRNLHAGDIKFKSEDDPVTIADQEAENLLRDRLLGLLPGSKLVGEEAFASDSSLLSLFSDESPVWIVDPIDGTKAFVSGEPYYGVIVALTKQNQTIAGWLYDPTSDEFITAESGCGAYYKGRKLTVLPPQDLSLMKGALGTHIRDAFDASPSPNGARIPSWRRMLSACHDYASLVVGEPHFSGKTEQIHFYATLRFCTPWDNAAGTLIHQEAGGYTAHWNGEAFSPCHFGQGFLSTPDKSSWEELSSWVSTFCELPGQTLGNR